MKLWQIALTATLGVLVVAGIVWFLFLRGPSGIGLNRPPAKKGMLRLATFNVEGLADGSSDSPSSPEHLAGIAEAIRLIDADILALQDVESLEALEWFRDERLAGMGYDHAASLDVGHSRGIENAVLSRYPIEASYVWPKANLGGKHPTTAGGQPNKYAGETIRFRRSPLMVQIALPDEDSRSDKILTLYVVEHKGGNAFDYWREAEAKALTRLAVDAGMNQPIVILGSFHAEPAAKSIETYLSAGFFDALGIDGESDRWATETSGDRTDFILANRVAMGILDGKAGFVLGGALAELREGSMQDATHLPVVIGLSTDD